eukprot:SAG11_NODE_1675_length_4475_cov_20.017824_2_plen_84_part_00
MSRVKLGIFFKKTGFKKKGEDGLSVSAPVEVTQLVLASYYWLKSEGHFINSYDSTLLFPMTSAGSSLPVQVSQLPVQSLHSST